MRKSEMLECLINYYTDGNKAKFSTHIGVKPQTVSAWLSRNTFDAEVIYEKCEGVSADWLLSGKGEMIKTGNQQFADNEIEIQSLKKEIERLKSLKNPQNGNRLYELWSLFMANQAQYHKIMEEMVAIYGNPTIESR
ncbi:helix-turn-helix domain-containing protein [Paraprevotella xylaniphila]|uniref:helix-turn-helix domain-containing protein n=1 Tax=Paraprevotella xylaniphila TaxID=454155 RepID=UPI0026670055|nr:helix-turn-helix domain-containing protein [Paraprevotella xylaniphila]